MARILVVEDEQAIQDTIILYLKHEGFEYLKTKNGDDALKILNQGSIDLVILDLMLEGLNGIEVCKAIRKKSNLPILMLTALSTEDDRIKGLDLGADDYVCKPFSPRELMSRVKALLRRSQSDREDSSSLSLSSLSMDGETREAKINSKQLKLTATEFDILYLMAERFEKVFSRQLLLDTVLPESLESSDRTIDTHINNIRRKMECCGGDIAIKTVFGVGYKLEKIQE